MTKITYNIGDKGWKKNFPHFKKYIGQAVNETLKQMDIKIDEDIVISIFLTSNNEIKKLLIYPSKSKAMNLAFDVTPAKYVTGLITEKAISEASSESLKKLFNK